MIKQYQDKNWLYKKYWEEKLSTYQIAKICGVSNMTIWYWLKKYNIPLRYIGKPSNHCNLSQEAIEWLNGELLGDGCLYSPSLLSARFQYTSKHKEYIKYISNTLNSFGIKRSGKINKYYDKKTGKTFYLYLSLNYIELLPIQKRWYPNGKKIVTRDIELTPLTCRQWYIGDGSLIKGNKRPRIRLATCGFSDFDINYLIKRLIKLKKFKITKQLANNIIGISTCSVENFLNYIGKCPVKCYQYKWAY